MFANLAFVRQEWRDSASSKFMQGMGVTDVNTLIEGTTPLHMASMENRKDVVQELWERGAKVNALNDHEETALKIAASDGHEQVVFVLLEHDADPNLMDKDGRGPLHNAVKYGYSDIAYMLLDAGANPKLSLDEDWSRSPLEMAAYSSPELLEKLRWAVSKDVIFQNNWSQTESNQRYSCRCCHVSI